MAERIIALGGIAEGIMAVVAKRSRPSPYPLNIFGGRDHVEARLSALVSFARLARKTIDEVTGLGDADTRPCGGTPRTVRTKGTMS